MFSIVLISALVFFASDRMPSIAPSPRMVERDAPTITPIATASASPQTALRLDITKGFRGPTDKPAIHRQRIPERGAFADICIEDVYEWRVLCTARDRASGLVSVRSIPCADTDFPPPATPDGDWVVWYSVYAQPRSSGAAATTTTTTTQCDGMYVVVSSYSVDEAGYAVDTPCNLVVSKSAGKRPGLG
jgi:hypothetical protein